MRMRFLLPLATAFPVVLGLFLAMSAMVSPDPREPEGDERLVLELAQVEAPAIDQPDDSREPEPPEEPPGDPVESAQSLIDAWEPPLRPVMQPWDLDVGDGGRPGHVYSDGEPVPLYRPQRIFPGRAAREGVNGTVVVRFTVTPTGGTTDIRIVSSEPAGYFEGHALAMVARWRYRPAMQDGEPVAYEWQEEIVYRLEDL